MYCHFGNQGSGKSYCMVTMMNHLRNIDLHKDKNVIVSNFSTPLNDIFLDSVKTFWDFLEYTRIERYLHGVKNVIHIFFDEAGSLFNSRNWENNLGEEGMSFFTQLRKVGIHFHYGTQHPSFVDVSIRRMTEVLYGYQPFLPIGRFDERGRRQPWGFRRTQYEMDMNRVDSGDFQKINSKIIWLKKSGTKLYNTSEVIVKDLNIYNSEDEKIKELVSNSQYLFTNIEDKLAARKNSLLNRFLKTISIPSPFFRFF